MKKIVVITVSEAGLPLVEHNPIEAMQVKIPEI
jgi:hypothetical protein